MSTKEYKFVLTLRADNHLPIKMFTDELRGDLFALLYHHVDVKDIKFTSVREADHVYPSR